MELVDFVITVVVTLIVLYVAFYFLFLLLPKRLDTWTRFALAGLCAGIITAIVAVSITPNVTYNNCKPLQISYDGQITVPILTCNGVLNASVFILDAAVITVALVAAISIILHYFS